MSRMIFYTASTLDGFIATENHSLDWLLSRDIDHDGPGGGAAFMSRIGAAAMGASTYQWVLDYAGVDKWEYEFPCWSSPTATACRLRRGPTDPAISGSRRTTCTRCMTRWQPPQAIATCG